MTTRTNSTNGTNGANGTKTNETTETLAAAAKRVARAFFSLCAAAAMCAYMVLGVDQRLNRWLVLACVAAWCVMAAHRIKRTA